MARYIPTNDGQGVIGIVEAETITTGHILSIGSATRLLERYRRDAWEQASKGSGYLANCFNAWANSLSDALTSAAELRAAAQIVDRSAA